MRKLGQWSRPDDDERRGIGANGIVSRDSLLPESERESQDDTTPRAIADERQFTLVDREKDPAEHSGQKLSLTAGRGEAEEWPQRCRDPIQLIVYYKPNIVFLPPQPGKQCCPEK